MPTPDKSGQSESDRRLRRSERIQKRTEFQEILAERASAADERLVVYVAKNAAGNRRLGISTPKRLGNAVLRNRLRRRVREAFRTNKDEVPIGYDVFCIVRSDAGLADFRQSLLRLIPRALRKRRTRKI